MPLIKSSLTLQANLFHEFHPMGGVSARFGRGSRVRLRESRSTGKNATHNDGMIKRRVSFSCTRFTRSAGSLVLKMRAAAWRRCDYNAWLRFGWSGFAVDGGLHAHSPVVIAGRLDNLCRFMRRGLGAKRGDRDLRGPRRRRHRFASGFGGLRRSEARLHHQRQWREHVVRWPMRFSLPGKKFPAT